PRGSVSARAPPKNPPPAPTRGLTRWAHRDPPSPALRCALIALRSGDGSPLWTIGTTRCAQSKMLPPPNKRGSRPPSTYVVRHQMAFLDTAFALFGQLGPDPTFVSPDAK